MIVVSDTSVITNLAAINQLILLNQLYGEVILPEAVYAELAGPPVSMGGMEAKDYDWIKVRRVSDRTMVDELLESLDIGESEAITLAIELNVEQILLDERDARELAEAKGLSITGVLGILIAAKEKALITEIRPLIVALRNQADFWLSPALCNRVLLAADELPL